MKSKILSALLSGSLFILFNTIQSHHASAQTSDQFSDKAVWMNTDYKLTLDNLNEKIGVVVISDERCVECGYYLRQLNALAQRIAAIQLVEIMVADTANPLSRKHLLNYIQRNTFNHPIGIFPDLSGFRDTGIKSAPFFLLYEKGKRTVAAGGHDGFVALTKRMEILEEQGDVFSSCQTHQFRSFIDPASFANPVVETPTYIAFEEGGEHVFLNDAAHNRLIEFDGNGSITHLIGSTLPGYFDQNIYTSQFNRPGGMVHANGKLFIADTYNNRVRVIDMASEQVSSLLGSGFITWKKVKAVDSRFEPFGLPIDLAVLGNMLYVLSATTNQLFEVDMKDGAARLLCDLPESNSGLLRNCPVNINAGTNVLYVTMADGKAWKVDRKGKISELKKGTPYRFVSVCEWKNGITGVTRNGRVVYLEEGKDWKVIGKQEMDGKPRNDIQVQGATDAMVKDGDLYVVDTDNHLVRMLGSTEDKLMKNFWFRPSQELVGFDAANMSGDLVVLDTLFMDKLPAKMHVLLDLEGYKVVAQGQNELIPTDMSGKAVIETDKLMKDEFSIIVQPDFTEMDVLFELYLTLENPENKGLFLIKRSYVVLPIAKQEGADLIQEQVLKPSLLPH